MRTGYQGMKWLKCDLQVQTPEDGKHWADDDLRLGNPRRPRVDETGQLDESDIQEKARKFLRRCHALELDVIGVTDHNFSALREPRDWFLTHLIQQNRSVARDLGREPLWVFPGFEVDVGYHLLCLFAPTQRDADGLQDISAVLTKLGLPETERHNADGPVPLRRDGQYVPLRTVLNLVQKEAGGIVVAAHAFRDDGICDEARDCEDYLNEELLAVEVPAFPLAGRVQDILQASSGKWKRPTRPPAAIMSSDAKSLAVDEAGSPAPNALGYRYSWIKMSEPSVESLRQAFLDPMSRIKLPIEPSANISPAAGLQHAHLVSLAIKNAAFITDQTAELSPNLNCIVGGRGSGKSTILEYFRICLRRDTTESATVREQIRRIRNTLGDDSSLRLKWRSKDNIDDVFVFDSGDSKARIEGRHVDVPEAVFAGLDVQIYSQKELSELSKLDENRQPVFLLSLVDRLCGDDLVQLGRQEEAAVGEIRKLLGVRRQLNTLNKQLGVLRQEKRELERQWEARSSLQQEARAHRKAQEARSYLDDVESNARGVAQNWEHTIAELEDESQGAESVIGDWPEKPWFETLEKELQQARKSLAKDLREAIGNYQSAVTSLTTGHEHWQQVQSAIARAEEAFQEACREKGLNPEDVARLKEIGEKLREKAAEVSRLEVQASQLEEAVGGLDGEMDRLKSLWWDQHELRCALAKGLDVPKLPGTDKPFLELTFGYLGERGHFFELWNKLAPDGRTGLGRSWDRLGAAAHSAFLARSCRGDVKHRTVWDLVEEWIRDSEEMPEELRTLQGELRKHLVGTKAVEWESTCLQRVRDAVDLTIYREDGLSAGSLQQGGLSDGQRNTAVLALLLTRGDGPVIVDQPEDELDSDFIYHRLVPMLRMLKERRQLIIVTHNANLPVNGDAELVYALAARNGRGVVRAEGALDRDSVRQAVLDIMEGSEEAFRRRREKYRY
jgi:DNA repair ATPase RecN